MVRCTRGGSSGRRVSALAKSYSAAVDICIGRILYVYLPGGDTLRAIIKLSELERTVRAREKRGRHVQANTHERGKRISTAVGTPAAHGGSNSAIRDACFANQSARVLRGAAVRRRKGELKSIDIRIVRSGPPVINPIHDKS